MTLFELLRHPTWLGAAVAFVAYVVLSLAMLPVWPVTIALGSIYGIWRGLLLAMPSSIAGAVAVFLLGQSILRDWARRRMAGSERLDAIVRAVGDRTGWIALLLRISPVVPFNLINYALSVTDMSFRVYLITTTVGILPATLMYLYIGSAAASIVRRTGYSGWELGLHLGGLLATVMAVWLVRRAVRRTLDAQLGTRV